MNNIVQPSETRRSGLLRRFGVGIAISVALIVLVSCRVDSASVTPRVDNDVSIDASIAPSTSSSAEPTPLPTQSTTPQDNSQTPEPDNAEPDNAEPEAAEPDNTEPDNAETGNAETEAAEPETTEPRAAGTGTKQPQIPAPLTHTPVDEVPLPYPGINLYSNRFDALRFEFDGIGSVNVGEFPFGSPIDPVAAFLSEALSLDPERSGDQIVFGGDEPVVTLTIVDDRLAAYTVDLVNWQSDEPVLLGRRSATQPFLLAKQREGEDLLIPLAYDDQGRLVRCAPSTLCVHQAPTFDDDGSPNGLRRATRFTAGWATEQDHRVTSYAAPLEGEALVVHQLPSVDSPPAYELSLTNGANVAVIGEPIESDGASWLRVYSSENPWIPAGYVDALAVEQVTAPRDSEGVLPRIERGPTDLVALLGSVHPEPLSDEGGPAVAGSLRDQLSDFSRERPFVIALSPSSQLSQFPNFDGQGNIIVLSSVTESGEWEISEVWRLDGAAGQFITNSAAGRCPILEGGDDTQAAQIVVDEDHQPIAGWVWLEADFVPVEVAQLSCQ